MSDLVCCPKVYYSRFMPGRENEYRSWREGGEGEGGGRGSLRLSQGLDAARQNEPSRCRSVSASSWLSMSDVVSSRLNCTCTVCILTVSFPCRFVFR
jgi:hypothetical protein